MLSKHFPAAELEAAADHVIAEDAEGRNTYVTLCAHGQDPGPYKRGRREDKVSAAVLWIDIDRKGPGHASEDLPSTVEDMVTLLRGIPFEPSFITDTGGGWHVYWMLSAPLALDDKTRDAFQETERALQRTLGEAAKAHGWHMDNTSDLARVLRPAGSHNHKPGRDEAPAVEFLVRPGEGVSYDYRILQRAFEVQETSVQRLFGGTQKIAPGLGEEDSDVETKEATPPNAGIGWDEARTVAEIRDKIKRNKKPERTEIFNLMLEGKPWAKVGERDSIGQKLASWLSYMTGGDGKADAIVGMVAPSIAAMHAENPPVTEEWFEEKVIRALGDARRDSEKLRSVEARLRERGFAAARERFVESHSRPVVGQKLPLGAPQDAPTLKALGGAGSSESAGCAPTDSAPGGAEAEPIPHVSADLEQPTYNAPALVPATDTTPAVVTALALAPRPAEDEEEPKPTDLTYYTREELQAAAADQEALSEVVCSIHDLKHRMVIQKSESFFVLKLNRDGFWRYGAPIQRGELDNGLVEDLTCLPEQIPTVEDPNETEPFFSWHVAKADGGVRTKTPKEVLAELATVARGDLLYDLRIPRSYFEPKDRRFYIAACPLREHGGPEYNPQIDGWLRTFGENEADREKWLDFCATLTDLRRPTCGVFLSGPPSTGKSMFAKGAAQLWADNFTEMENVFSSFNSGIASCPLLVADETLPSDHTGRTVSTKLLRRIISEDSRSLRRKFQPEATILGAVRCLFLSNNEDMIGQGDESLGADALEAVAGRFLHIRLSMESVYYLRALGGRGGTAGWVDQFKIAKHLLWLRDTRKVVYGDRFIVEGHASKVSQLIATNGTTPGLVCEWLARFLSKPLEGMLRNRYVILGGGKFLVNGPRMLDAWADLIKSDRASPTLARINRALGGISFSEAGTIDNKTRYWSIRPDVILQFAEENQIGDGINEMKARIEGPEMVFKGGSVSALFGNTKEPKR